MVGLDKFLDEEFNDLEVPPSEGRPEPISPGRYTLQVEDGQIGYTKKGDGVIFKARMAVVTGPHANHQIWAQYNIRNPSVQAQTIGIAELKALCAAVGVQWEDVKKESSVLFFKPFQAELGMERESINQATGKPYPPRNRIVKYYAKGTAVNPVSRPQGELTAAAPKQMKPVPPDNDVPF